MSIRYLRFSFTEHAKQLLITDFFTPEFSNITRDYIRARAYFV